MTRLKPSVSLNDGHVIVDRAVGAVVLADRLAADHAHVGEQVLSQFGQHLVARELDDGLVEGDVHFRVFVEPGMWSGAVEPGEHAAQPGDVLVAGVLGDQARRHALERGPGSDHLDHFLLGLADHVDAAARDRADEALALELGHGLADGGAGDAEILRELSLIEADVGARAIDARRYDDVAQGLIGLVLEGFAATDGRHDETFAHERAFLLPIRHTLLGIPQTGNRSGCDREGLGRDDSADSRGDGSESPQKPFLTISPPFSTIFSISAETRKWSSRRT